MTLPSTCESELDALQRTEQLFLDATRRTDEFLATLGHEMRNPLGALSNAVEVWPIAARDPVQMEDLRKTVQRQVVQLIRLSDDLLDVARISQGKLNLRRDRVGIRELIEGAVEEVRPFIDRCGHTLTVWLPAQPVFVYGDASRLLQVFANLIQNAAKFTEHHGSLDVSVDAREGTAVIRVRDNGAGIADHMRTAIFEAFTQVEGNNPLGQRGLGIGLRLVKTIVELHAGTIGVRSEGVGCGSEFTVQLPIMDAAPHEKPLATVPIPAGHDLQPPPLHQILVVDDDRSSAELLARILRSIGQTVAVADNGITAIRMVLEQRPQIVFLDIMMRGMNGCEVARQLRSYPELDGLLLIALSGNGDEEIKRRALDAGFDRYLVKPTSVAELVETLAGFPSTTPVDDASNRSEPRFNVLRP